MKKSLIALIVPACIALTSCSFLSGFINGGGNGNNKNVPEAEKEYNKTIISYDGEEANKNDFLSAFPNRKTLSAEARGYNYTNAVHYRKCIEDDEDLSKKYGVKLGFAFDLVEENSEWVWEYNGWNMFPTDEQKQDDHSDDFVMTEPQDIIEERATDKTKYYIGQDSLAMIHHYKEDKGNTTYYYRLEIKWNKNGDVLAVEDYKVSALKQDESTFVESTLSHHRIEYQVKTLSN